MRDFPLGPGLNRAAGLIASTQRRARRFDRDICRDGGATPMTLEADDWVYSAAI